MRGVSYELLVSSFIHPNSEQPYRGLFNKRALSSLAAQDECSLSVYSPVPYAPPIGPYSRYRAIPDRESFDCYEVQHPRVLYPLPKRLFFSLTGSLFRRSLRTATEGESPDVIHGCHIYPDGWGLLGIQSNRDVPLTVTCHGYFLNNFSGLPPGVASRIRKLLNTVDHVFCVSEALRAKATTIGEGVCASTVPIGAEPARFPTEEKDQLRENYGIGSAETVFLFVGQFIRRKGIGNVIDLLPELPNEDVRYVFIGHGGELLEEFTRATRRLDSDVRVFEGMETATLREWYAIADVLLLPSYEEGRPTVIYEAMAAETAVLSTNIDGVREQVVDGKTGLLVDPNDTDQLLDTIHRCANGSVDVTQLGQAGKNRLLSEGWTWTDHAERIIEYHEELLKEQSR